MKNERDKLQIQTAVVQMVAETEAETETAVVQMVAEAETGTSQTK
jgi:hypothetical protein